MIATEQQLREIFTRLDIGELRELANDTEVMRRIAYVTGGGIYSAVLWLRGHYSYPVVGETREFPRTQESRLHRALYIRWLAQEILAMREIRENVVVQLGSATRFDLEQHMWVLSQQQLEHYRHPGNIRISIDRTLITGRCTAILWGTTIQLLHDDIISSAQVDSLQVQVANIALEVYNWRFRPQHTVNTETAQDAGLYGSYPNPTPAAEDSGTFYGIGDSEPARPEPRNTNPPTPPLNVPQAIEYAYLSNKPRKL